MNELVLDFKTPLTPQRIATVLQRAFFGLSFHPDGTINDHRQYTIPDGDNRLVAIITEDKDLGECLEQMRMACAVLHRDLFVSVFEKADVKESGRDDLDRLFVMTQTPDNMRQADYYQFTAKTRSEVPFTCVWITNLSEIPSFYENFFGTQFKVNYD